MDEVNNPTHYTRGGIETIAFIKAKLSPEEYCGMLKGNIIKYLSRAGHKGNEVQDLQKTQWYLEELIQEKIECP